MQIGERDQCWQRRGPVMRSDGRGPAWIETAALVVGLWVAMGATPATAGSSSQCRRLCRRDASGCTVEVARCRAQATTAFRDGSAACLSDVPARASGASPMSSLHGALRACRRAYRACERVAIKDCARSAREPLIAEHADSSTCPATPRPSCTEIGPDDECRDPLHPADRFFWDTLRAGTYGAIPDVLERLQAALAGCPGNPSLTRHVAWANVWRVAESARGNATTAELVQSLLAVQPAFALAWSLEPDDPRILGFLGSVTFGQGFTLANAAQQAEGLAMLDEAAAAWPEFNFFTAGYVTSELPQDSPGFQRALDYQWRNLDICAGAPVDRQDPDLAPLLRRETHAGRQRACFNSWIAPFNWEGFFLNFGDMLVKNRDPRTAVRIYAAAKLDRSYERWPYRSVLEARIQNAEANVAAFNRSDPPPGDDTIMLQSSFSCMGCHQAR
jgi:hypothetical protein